VHVFTDGSRTSCRASKHCDIPGYGADLDAAKRGIRLVAPPASTAVASMMPKSKIAESSRADGRELRELIAALDRRVPQVERVRDPAKVVRIALQYAASIASLMLATETLVSELPREDEGSRRRSGRNGRVLTERAV
jgi:hypothetical protein